MLTIDGAIGEGGGQIVRSSLALALVTGTPVEIVNIRAGRAKPGLMRQHLTAVNAAAAIGRAKVRGALIGSQKLTFEPGEVSPGEYRFAVGTAGSTTLVLQTVLPPLLTASGSSVLTLEGGTHNPHAPPFEFLAKAFAPIIARMGAKLDVALERHGFYPAGGGRIVVRIEPAATLKPVELLERGETFRRRATAIVAGLPVHIAQRELKTIHRDLKLAKDEVEVVDVGAESGPGNAVMIEIESQNVTEVFTGFAERGVRAESIAGKVAAEARQYLAAGVPVGTHLADQLLLPMALAGGGAYKTLPPSSHTRTNMEVLRQFTDVRITIESCGDAALVIRLQR